MADMRSAALIYTLLRGLVLIGAIIASWVPLQPLVEIARALAGRQTNVTMTFAANLTISLVATGTALALWVKSRGQGRELKRQRERIEQLERKIGALEVAAEQRESP